LIGFEQLPNIESAVEIISQAIREQWYIVVSGDYDCDGATGSAIGYRGLRLLGANRVKAVVPDRTKDGYGLTPGLVERMDGKTQLIITVDAGTASVEGIRLAQGLGIKVVVTDHHLPSDVLPDCPIVNPNLYYTNTALSGLCGAAVMFYVLIAVRRKLRLEGYYRGRLPELETLLSLVAIGTIADLMPLNYNNRILVKQGLTKIQCDVMPKGLRELIRQSGRDYKTISATDISFGIAPIINAAGRIETMDIGVEALCVEDNGKIERLINRLVEINQSRKEQQAIMVEEAKSIVEDLPMEYRHGLVVYQGQWHPGIVGLVASQIKQKHNRPVFAFAPASPGANELRGSGRSIEGIHIRDALAAMDVANPGMILKFGGHAMAAGLSLDISQLDRFRTAFSDYIKSHPAVKESAEINDGYLKSDELTVDTAKAIMKAGPWGNGFPEPVFEGVFNVASCKVLKEKYLKLNLVTDDGLDIEGIYFNWGKPDTLQAEIKRVKIHYQLQISMFHKPPSVQLLITNMEGHD